MTNGWLHGTLDLQSSPWNVHDIAPQPRALIDVDLDYRGCKPSALAVLTADQHPGSAGIDGDRPFMADDRSRDQIIFRREQTHANHGG